MGLEEHTLLAHPESHVRLLEKTSPTEGFAFLDSDTVMSPGSLDAALRAVGAATMAVDKVMMGETAAAFVAMRPPGHHAEPDRPMGFCLFSNIAIAAKYARSHHGVGKVAVLDFDVHHGNGTQKVFENDRNLLFASSHQMPLYPGTGTAGERGCGNIFNAPLSAGDGGRELLAVWRKKLLPAILEEKPELILVSAGFDAHRADPLAGLNVETEDFRELTLEIAELADKTSNGRIISMLEGGYDLAALGESVAAHLEALSEAGS